MAKRIKKGLQRVVRYARANDWQIERTRGGHLRLTKEGMPPVYTSSTPSDTRSENNAIAMLKRSERIEAGNHDT